MRKIISEYETAIMKKSENSGCIELRNEIKSYLLRNKGICVNNNQIIIGSGSEYLYRLVVELLGKENVFAFESPSYEKIEKVYSSLGVKCAPLPLGNNGIKSEALSKTRADVLHITPYRSFPTGITASASKRYEYVRWASRKKRYIIEDDFESEFSVSRKNEETVFSLSKNENCIYMNTFSKTLSSGIRLGYMVLPVSLAEKFEKKLGFYSCTVPTFEQLVIAEILANGSFERHINRVRRYKRKRLDK
jgi:GntR family transcriptional regulator/MocR family aminotransferase